MKKKVTLKHFRKTVLLLSLLFVGGLIYPLTTVHANAGPPANIRLNVIHEGLDYAIDFLIQPEQPITLADQEAARRRILEHEVGIAFALDYFKQGFFPRELIEFETEDGFVSSTLYGRSDYAYFIPTQVAFEDQYVIYFRVPRVFRIALVTEGDVFTSEVITMTDFDFDITWDVRGLDLQGTSTDVGTITGLNTHPFTRLTTYVHFFIRVVVTLAVELLLLFLLGFRKKITWIQVSILNIITQSALTLGTIYVFSLTASGIGNALVLFILGEMLIFTVEAFYLGAFVHEKSVFRRVGYSLLANALSLIAGLFLMIALFSL